LEYSSASQTCTAESSQQNSEVDCEVQYYFRLVGIFLVQRFRKALYSCTDCAGSVCLLQNVNVGLKVNSVATLLIQRAGICRLVVTKSDENPRMRMIPFKLQPKYAHA
jgi:hypothetical protein